MKILGIAGSLRKGSLNRALLQAIADVEPQKAAIELAEISDLPLYNEDVEEEGFPDPVTHLADQIRACDCLLIATPEYNYSVPGVLKNAIDWVSRVDDQPFNGKPIAILGASKGALGTSRSQYQLRQIFVALNGSTMSRPEVFVGSAHEKFDDQGKLIDQGTRDFLATYKAAVVDWAEKVRG